MFAAKSALDWEGRRLRASEVAGVNNWHRMSVLWKLVKEYISVPTKPKHLPKGQVH